MEDNTPELEIGERYVLRNGLVTSPLRLSNNGTNYRYEASVIEPEYETPSIMSWLKTGKFLTNDIDHRYDIITKIINI